MTAFIARYGTEAQCAEALAAQRWLGGFRCPACGHAEHLTFERAGRRYWECQYCRHQTTVIAGTIFEATILPLTVWFLAMHLST